MRLSQIANLTRNLGCEPLHDRKWSLDQRQSKLNYDRRTQAAWTYASQRQPDNPDDDADKGKEESNKGEGQAK